MKKIKKGDSEVVMSDGKEPSWKKILKLNTVLRSKENFFTEYENKNVLLTPGNFKIGGGFN